MGHFYKYDGTKCFTYLTQKGEQKETTLREAKKWGLLPSVTSINSIVSNYSLSQWEKQQVLKAILSAPEVLNFYKGTQETFDETYSLVEDLMREQNVAMQTGVEIHKAIEDFINKKSVPSVDSIAFKYIGRINLLLNQTFGDGFTLQSEVPFAANGYGGTIDMTLTTKEGKNYLIDFKTTTRKKFENWKAPYPNETSQLAAYIKGLRFFSDGKKIVEPLAFIIKIDNERGGIKAYSVKSNELHEGWKRFSAYLNAYAVTNDYPELITMFNNAQNMEEVKNICEQRKNSPDIKKNTSKDALIVVDDTEQQTNNTTNTLPPPVKITANTSAEIEQINQNKNEQTVNTI